jgi:nucleoside 2-deoxyribosyltransferase
LRGRLIEGTVVPKLTIYLAGPEVFLPGFGKAVFDGKKSMCATFGFEGISPMDGDLSLEGLSAFQQGIAIYQGNLAHMRACDAVIANMTPFRGVSVDPGTAFEMGYMAASGKPVLGYTHVMSQFHHRSLRYYEHGRSDLLETYSAGSSVERFDMTDNLMMVGAVDCAGFKVQQAAVPPGEELTSLAGFRLCLIELQSQQRR